MSAPGEWADHNDGVDEDLVDEDVAEGAPDDVGAEHQLYYPTVEAFVRELLAPTYRRHLDGGRTRTWCPQWWNHAEAITRLEALWRAWEFLRLDPATGVSVWLRDHADHHMAVLMDADGPFKGCTPEKGHSDRLKPLPVEEPPDGLFTAPN